jgi:hypothetical protein
MADRRKIKNAYGILLSHLKRRDGLESKRSTEICFREHRV